MLDCPPVEHLQHFLANRLTAVAEEALCAHVEACAACQRALECLVAGGADAGIASFRKGEDAPEPDEEQVLHQLKKNTKPADWSTLHWEASGRRGPIATGQSEAPAPSMAFRDIPGYEILEELGRGGMGVVFRARQVGLNRIVALKTISAGNQASLEERARFRTEAEAAAALQHANIVQVYDVGEYDGTPYLSMELMDGGTLAARLGGRPQPAHSSAVLVETLARAAHHAHTHGIIHRDLKPGNILLQGVESRQHTADSRNPGQARPDINTDTNCSNRVISSSSTDYRLLSTVYSPKIADFGLAKRLGDLQQTRHGAILGTPSYMAPEQARGNGTDPGPAVDIYALGAILFEMLTGRPPFVGESWESTLAAVIREEPIPPRNLQPKCPRDLETICLKCLEKEPRQRYSSSLELADDLHRFLAGEPVLARRAGWVEQAAKWARRRPAVAALSAGIVLVSLLGLTGVVVSWREAVRNASAEIDARRDAERQLANSYCDQGIGLCEKGYLAQGMLLLVRSLELAEKHHDSDLIRVGRANLSAWRNQVWRQRTLMPHSHWVWEAVYSPDGKLLATASKDKAARLWDSVSGQLRCEPLKHDDFVTSVSFHPDGATLLTSAGDNARGEVRFWDVATGRQLGEKLSFTDLVLMAAWSADGRTVLTLTANGVAQRWDPIGRVAKGPPLACPTKVGAALFGVDGQTIITGEAAGTVRFWDVATGQARGSPLVNAEPVTYLAVHPGGRMLLVGTMRPRKVKTAPFVGEANVWRESAGEWHSVDLHIRGIVKAAAFSADGRLLATGCLLPREEPSKNFTGELCIWELDRLGAANEHLPDKQEERSPALLTALPHPAPIWSVAFTPDGRCLASGAEDGKVRWFATGNGVLVREVKNSHPYTGGTVRALHFSRDGRTLLTGGLSTSTCARIFETPPMRLLPVPLRFPAPTGALAISPDGRRLLCGGGDKTLREWDLITDKPVGEPITLPQALATIAFSPDGERFLTSNNSGVVREWDATRREQLATPFPAASYLASYSPDGRFVGLRRANGQADIWDRATQKVVRTLAYSENGGVQWGLASRVIPMSDLELRAARPLDSAVPNSGSVLTQKPTLLASFVASPNGRFLAIGYTTGGVQLWATDTERPFGPLLPHVGLVYSLVFSPDGAILATADRSDNLVRLWDVATGKAIGPPLPHRSPVYGLAFQPAGRLLVTSCADGSVFRWEAVEPMTESVERLRQWVQVLHAAATDENGFVHDMDLEAWSRLRKELEETGGPAAAVMARHSAKN